MNKIDVFTLGETMVLFQPEQMHLLNMFANSRRVLGGRIKCSNRINEVGTFSGMVQQTRG